MPTVVRASYRLDDAERISHHGIDESIQETYNPGEAGKIDNKVYYGIVKLG